MTQTGWSHVILPVDFAEKLKAGAQTEGIPVWKYLEKRTSLESLWGLVPLGSSNLPLGALLFMGVVIFFITKRF